MSETDRTILRDLARRYLEICRDPVQEERRRLWRDLNSRRPTRPLIYVRAFAWSEMAESVCRCQDPLLRQYEDFFRSQLFRWEFGDDFIFEPWVTLPAVRPTHVEGIWGVRTGMHRPDGEGTAGEYLAPIKAPEDVVRLIAPDHVVDEAATARLAGQLDEAIGDLIAISIDRGPVHQMWQADISTELAHLRGLEQFMYDMVDRPQWLHELLAFMRDAILKTHSQAEAAGDWRLAHHQNQAMPYAHELADPAADSPPVRREQLWCFCASQETTLVGPEMFEEFMLRYQIPIIEQFGLCAYGCCEDLSRKIPLLRKIHNLRRVAVSPMADVAKCVEQIGTDYVMSYRPSPADMVAYGFDADRIGRILERDLAICRGGHFDITLKDVETVQGDGDRIRKWTQLTRRIIDRMF